MSRNLRTLKFQRLEDRLAFNGAAPRVADVSLKSSATSFIYMMPVGEAQSQPIPWAQLDQLQIRFDKDVTVPSGVLIVEGTYQRQILVSGYTYDQTTRTAVWTLETGLLSDRYIVRLSDSIVGQGNKPLDGEWWDKKSVISGDGIPGGDFIYSFDLLIGDVNQSGQTTPSDFRRVSDNQGSSIEDNRLDVNTDGVVGSDDMQWIEDSYGDLRGLAEPGQSLSVVSVGDQSGDGLNEFVSLTSGSKSTLSLHNPASNGTLAIATLNDSFRFIDLEPIFSNSEVATGVAVLGMHRENGGIRVWIWDLQTSRPAHSISFNRSKIAEDLEVFYNPNTGMSEVAVLTRNPLTGRSRVELAEVAANSASEWIDYGVGFVGFDLEIMQSNGTGAPLLVVAGSVPATGGTRVKTIDREARTVVSNISFGRITPIDLEVYNDSGEQRIALLRRNSLGVGAWVDIRNLGGNRIDVAVLSSDDVPIDLEVSLGHSLPSLAILTENVEHRENIVHLIRPGEGTPQTMSFGSGYTSTDFAMGAGIDGIEVMVAQQNPLLDVTQVKIRNATRQTRIATVPIHATDEIPAWFDENRIQGITRLSMVDPRQGLDRSYYQTIQSDAAAQLFAELGARTFTRHALTMDEDPWWPSELPVDENGLPLLANARDNLGISLGERENLVQGFVNLAWAENMPMMGYVWDIGSSTLANLHPEWVCKTAAGATASHIYKGDYLDITGPFGDIVQQRLLELADMGISGLYLDFRHVPAGGCWGSQMETDFTNETGLPAPPIANTLAYRLFAEYSARRMQEVISGWEQRLHREYPSLQLIVSVTSVPALTRLDMNTDLVAIDNPKSEFSVAIGRGQNNSVFHNYPNLYEPPEDIRMALGWLLLRDASDNGLPHIWNSFTPNRDHLLAFLSAVTTYGGIAALDVAEELLLPGGNVEGIATREDMAEGFALGNRISPHLSNTDPIPWAAVLFSENSRNARGIDSLAIWEEVNLPTVGAFQAIQRSQRPVSILTDKQLASGVLMDYEVLLLPNPDELSPEQISAVQAFTDGGGTVIENDDSWDWSSELGYESAISEIQMQLDGLATTAPVRVTGLPDGAHAVSYQKESGEVDGRIVVAITNRFDFSQASTIFDLIPPDDINATPANIQPGASIFLSDDLVSRFWPVVGNQLTAMETVGGIPLIVEPVVGGFNVVLPEIERLAVVVFEMSDSLIIESPSSQTESSQGVNQDRRVFSLDALIPINTLNGSHVTSSKSANEIRAIDVNEKRQLSALNPWHIIKASNGHTAVIVDDVDSIYRDSKDLSDINLGLLDDERSYLLRR